MTLRVYDASYDMQKTLQDILNRLSKLETKISSVEDPRGRADDIRDLQHTVRQLLVKPTTLDFNDVFRAVGPAHALGYVPDPGLTPAVSDRFLRDDGTWAELDDFVLLGMALSGDC